MTFTESQKPFFVEKSALDSRGLRFVGFADEISHANGSRRIEHTGWFSDTNEDATYRGAVMQLPGRKGQTRFVAAYQDSNGGFVVDPSEVFIEPAFASDGGDDPKTYGAALEAAKRADRNAEIDAEHARDYDEAWQAGARWSQLGDDAREARQGVLTILRERKRLAAIDAPASRSAVCAHVRRLLDQIREFRSERDKLTDNVGGTWYRASELEGAFNEGAGKAVFAA